MKSAKEMFEDLGYKYFENSYWVYLTKGTNFPIERICFIKSKKEITIEKFTTNNKILTKNISILELKAINKQIEELGWYK